MTKRRGCVMVTRPADAAAATARRLRGLGFSAVCAPALAILCEDGPPPEGWRRARTVVATSPRAFIAPVPDVLKRRPLYAVGERTAAAARRAGFARVLIGPADGRALAEMLLAAPENGPVLHLAGAHTQPALAARLGAAGVAVMTWRRYRAAPVPAMPAHARRLMAAGRIDAVLFYSARTAAAFRAWLDDLLTARLSRVDAWAISRQALAPVADLGWRYTEAAPRARENALLTALARHYPDRQGDEEP